MSSDWDRPMTEVDEVLYRHPWLGMVIWVWILLLAGFMGAME